MDQGDYWLRFSRVRRSRRSVIGGSVAVGAGLAAAGLIGCGDDDDGNKGTSASPAARGAQPKRGGTITRNTGDADQSSHDVHQTTSASVHVNGSGAVYSRLIRRKLVPGREISLDILPEGDLAASWEQPNDLTYIFKLHPNIKWQNLAPVNGRALTAQDIVYSAERQIGLKVAAGTLPIKSIAAVDGTTIRVELAKPDSDFLINLTNAQNKVVAREAVELKGDLKEGPVVGSGAWIMDQFVPNNVIKFRRNPDYFRQAQDGKSYPYADNLEILRIQDVSLSLAAFRTRQILARDLTRKELDALKKDIPDLQSFEWKEASPAGGSLLILRADAAPTNDIRVRQGIARAIDRQAIMQATAYNNPWMGGALLAVTSEDDLLSEDELKRLLPHDPAGARQLLQQAGFSGWKPKLSAWNRPTTAQDFPAVAELVQAQVKAIGIEGTIDPMRNEHLPKWFTEGDREFVVFIRGNRIFGANADLSVGYKTGGARNVAHISDPELERLADAQAAELKDRPRRRQLLHQIQRRIIELAAVTPIYGNRTLNAQHHDLRDWYLIDAPTEPGWYEVAWLDR